MNKIEFKKVTLPNGQEAYEGGLFLKIQVPILPEDLRKVSNIKEEVILNSSVDKIEKHLEHMMGIDRILELAKNAMHVGNDCEHIRYLISEIIKIANNKKFEAKIKE